MKAISGWVQRSRNAELLEGSSDGSHRKLRPNTVDPEGRNTAETLLARQALLAEWHGINSVSAPRNPGTCTNCC